jgi:hypothetical protein
MTYRMPRKYNVSSHFRVTDPSSAGSGRHDLVVVGWQEMVGLPELGIEQLPVKLDTGAVSSSLHVEHIRYFRRNHGDWVRFDLGAGMGATKDDCRCESRLIGFRGIQSSSGHRSHRPVIETMMVLAGFYWTIELTLANRPTMQFPVLIGRDALSGRCLVDCGQIFLANSRYTALQREI